MPEQLYADARAVIEAARRMAEQGRAKCWITPPRTNQGMDGLVAWAYLMGAVSMLKILMGDFTPEPWTEDYDHEARLTELLNQFHATRLEQRTAAWVRTRIGERHMHSRERAMRLLEEAIELAQAENISSDAVRRQVDHVYCRPPGEPAQEASGVATCLFAWCAATGNTVVGLATSELERIEAKPLDQIRGSLARKADADLVTVVQDANGDAPVTGNQTADSPNIQERRATLLVKIYTASKTEEIPFVIPTRGVTKLRDGIHIRIEESDARTEDRS